MRGVSAYHKFRHVIEEAYGINDKMPIRYDEAKATEAFSNAALAGVNYWRTHGRDPEVGSKFAFMTTARLMKSFKIAFEHWKKEKQMGAIVVIAAEQAFNVQLPDGSFRSRSCRSNR